MNVKITESDKIPFELVESGSVFYAGFPTIKHNSGYFMKISTNQNDCNAVHIFTGSTAYFGKYEDVTPVNAELVIKK